MPFSVLDRYIGKGAVFVEDYDAPDSYENYSSGLPISKPKRPARLFYPNKTAKKTDMVGGIHSFPVISNRFRALLERENVTHIDFHPVELVCTKSAEVDKSYSFLLILDNVPCLDRQRSEYETLPGADDVILGVSKLVISEDRLKGRDLVRVAEKAILALVSDRLGAVIKREDLAGILLRPLNEITLP